MTHPAIFDGKHLLNRLGIDPVYVIAIGDLSGRMSDAEHRYLFSPGHNNMRAFTSPILDVMFKRHLRYEWKGRGFCCAFRQSPSHMSQVGTLGTLIHEAGHYVEFCNRPSRDEADTSRALELSLSSTGPGLDDGHNDRWIRATAHLLWRAWTMGCSIPAEGVLHLGRYDLSPTQQYINALLPECSARDGESIETILSTPAPSAFQSLYQRDRPGTVRQSRPAATQQRPVASTPLRQATATGRRRIHMMRVGGKFLESFSDGTSALDGKRVSETEVRKLLGASAS